MLIGNKNWTLSHTVFFGSLRTKPEAAMTERKKERKKEMNEYDILSGGLDKQAFSVQATL